MKVLTDEEGWEIFSANAKPDKKGGEIASGIARAIESAVLAKLAKGFVIPEYDLHDGITLDHTGRYKSSEDGYTEDALRAAYAAGAAAQLSEVSVGYVYSVHGEKNKSAVIQSDVPNGTPLYTRKE